MFRLILVKKEANFVRLFRSQYLLNLYIEYIVQSIFNYAGSVFLSTSEKSMIQQHFYYCNFYFPVIHTQVLSMNTQYSLLLFIAKPPKVCVEPITSLSFHYLMCQNQKL